MMNTELFDQAAGTWDLTDRRVALAHGVTEAIKGAVALTGDLSVLDFGCGTGLVTLALAPLVGAITGADTSSGMLATLADKARAQAETDSWMPWVWGAAAVSVLALLVRAIFRRRG